MFSEKNTGKKSDVVFAPFTPNVSRVEILKKLLAAMDFNGVLKEGDLTAVKLHFGEKGNDTYLRPIFVRALVDDIKRRGGKPFLCDSNTLYAGSRKNSVDHLITAIENGFDYAVVGAPLIISDGLRGGDYREVAVNGDFFKSVKIASAVADADALVVISHFKGHVRAGFGGAIKNLAMGCAPAQGKKEQHAVNMAVNEERCIGCGRCSRHCPEHAISMVQTANGAKAHVDDSKCIGCCECMTICTSHAVGINWNGNENDDNYGDFNRRMAEYAAGAVKKFKKVMYVNVMMDITPLCDCCGWSNAPVVPDIGFAASTDPVALDMACYDMVTAARFAYGMGDDAGEAHDEHCCHGHHHGEGVDKFGSLYPQTRSGLQMDHAEKMGMGTRQYNLLKLDVKPGDGE